MSKQLVNAQTDAERITHPRYNKQNYPKFVCHHGSWDIYANDNGHCASIPTVEGDAAGCAPSHFGNMAYVKMMASLGMLNSNAHTHTAAGSPGSLNPLDCDKPVGGGESRRLTK